MKAIAGFLRGGAGAACPYNVFLAADIFGYVCWNLNDTDIGQKLDPIASAVDYLSPMLYPSGFQFGIPGYRNPVQHPYEIVYLSLKKAQERTKISPRPLPAVAAGLQGLRLRPPAVHGQGGGRADQGRQRVRLPGLDALEPAERVFGRGAQEGNPDGQGRGLLFRAVTTAWMMNTGAAAGATLPAAPVFPQLPVSGRMIEVPPP